MALASPAPTAGPGAISALLGPNGDPLPAEQVLAAITKHVAETGLEQVLASSPQPRRRLRLGLLDLLDGIFGELLLAVHASRRYRCANDHANGQARS